MSTDRIEKQIMLRAPQDRVWRAITDAREFGVWFGVEVLGEFVAGETAIGTIAPTKLNADVAQLQEPHREVVVHFAVERITPTHHFSYRWHPFAIDPAHDYDDEPMTLVSFDLSEVAGGTLLTITETGFDQLPIARRASCLKANTNGWNHQAGQMELYLA